MREIVRLCKCGRCSCRNEKPPACLSFIGQEMDDLMGSFRGCPSDKFGMPRVRISHCLGSVRRRITEAMVTHTIERVTK